MGEELNGKEKVYCLVPFAQMSTKPDGSLRPCCASGDKILLKSDSSESTLNLNRDSLTGAWNSSVMVSLREKFLKGESDLGCSECALNEGLGKKSTRQWKNESWPRLVKENLEEARENGYRIENAGPISLELRLGNLCNLNCRMCNPIFSSRWKSDLENDEQWRNTPQLTSILSGPLEMSKQQGHWYQSRAFWDDILSYAKGLRSLYLSGGEPLIIEELTPFLEKLSKLNAGIKIRLDSNLMQLPDETLSLLSRFKEVSLGASVDAIGPALEYIRNGSREKVIVENLRKLVGQSSVFTINLSVTYMALNALELYELFIFIKGDEFKDRISVNIDILYKPSCLSVKCLPAPAREQAKQDIVRICKELDHELSREEKRNLDSLYKYLEDSEQGDIDSLINYNKWLDGIHDKKLEHYLPKLHHHLVN